MWNSAGRLQASRHGHFPSGALHLSLNCKVRLQQPPLGFTWPQLRSRTASWFFKQSTLLCLLDTVPPTASFLPWTPSHFLPHQTGMAGGGRVGSQANSASSVPFSFIPLIPSTQASLPFPTFSLFVFWFVVIVALLLNIKLTHTYQETGGRVTPCSVSWELDIPIHWLLAGTGSKTQEKDLKNPSHLLNCSSLPPKCFLKCENEKHDHDAKILLGSLEQYSPCSIYLNTLKFRKL